MGDERSWQDVPISVFLGGLAVFCVAAYFCHSGQRWLPLVDGVNLLFHEAGHFFLGIVSDPLEVYGGTLGQLVFPVVTMGYFFKGVTRHPFMFAEFGASKIFGTFPVTSPTPEPSNCHCSARAIACMTGRKSSRAGIVWIVISPMLVDCERWAG